MDRGKITYDGDGQLWRVDDGIITDQWLHDYASIRCCKLPDERLTVDRKAFLQQGYKLWMEQWGTPDLVKVGSIPVVWMNNNYSSN